MKLILCMIMALVALPAVATEAVFVGEYRWLVDDEKFGGFSGLEVSDDGTSFISNSDRGNIIKGQFKRDAGKIVGVINTEFVPLLDTKGVPLEKYHVDAEGLAIDDQGRLFLSFEAEHRVWLYEDFGGTAIGLKRHEDFKGFQNNSGLESLAIDKDGTLFTMPERSGEWERPFPVYRFKDNEWDSPFTIPRRGRYLPVGADFGPDGKFYLLERDFLWYTGFSNRVRRFDLTPEGFTNEETLLTAPSSAFGNLEGISVWRDRQDRIRMTMISDDDFRIILSTKFVEFTVH